MQQAKIIGKWDFCPELIPKHTYTEARGRATAKWQAKNREYYNAYQHEDRLGLQSHERSSVEKRKCTKKNKNERR